MRKRSGAVKVESYEELLDEVLSTQMKHRDQVCSSGAASDPIAEDALSTLPDEDDEIEFRQPLVTVKLLVTGRQGVGKGALIKRFLEHNFSADYEATDG
jgi:hypothetical protein